MSSRPVVLGLIGALSITGWGVADAQGSRPRALDTRTLWVPTPVATMAGRILAYELHITNVSRRDLRLVGIDIVRGSGRDAFAHSLRGDSLLLAMEPVGARDTTDSVALLRSGRQVVIFLWEPAGNRTAGSVSLAHSLFVVPADSLAAAPDTVGPIQVTVQPRSEEALAAPLAGGPWFARNGPSNTADHRRTLVAVGGVARIAQRFATDWIMLGPEYRMWHGDSTVNGNWYGYGVAVHAAAPGVIVAAHDGEPDNTPLASERTVPITLETVAGNYIIEDLGSGRFALYAHLRPGSLKARVGMRINAGEVLGSLGNSGNSGAPHLHFHLMDNGASPLGGEGLPFVFQEYITEGTVRDLDDLFRPTAWMPELVSARHRELPTENMVVRFPVLPVGANHPTRPRH
jgi:murein DD-endopeptidase